MIQRAHLIAVAVTGVMIVSLTTHPQNVHAQDARPALNGPSVDVFAEDRVLWLMPTSLALRANQLSIPRVDAPVRSLTWKDGLEDKIQLTPEPEHWVITWKRNADAGVMIRVELEDAVGASGRAKPIQPSGDGSVMLPAHAARTFGEKLRYEPQWYKNTIGYWTVATDYAQWDARIDSPGRYSVAVLQGCGKDQGGSDASLTLRADGDVVAELPFQPIDTGHFQNFRWHHLGDIQVDRAGDYQLRISAVKIAKAALLDVRAVHLVRQAQ